MEFWLRAAREPELRPVAARLYARYHQWLEGLLRDPTMEVDAARAQVADFVAAQLGIDPAASSPDPSLRPRSGDAEPAPGHRSHPPSADPRGRGRVIAERGVAATRIADVAERCGVSAPSVLYWFASREQLLAEALIVDDDRFHEEVSERVEEAATPGPSGWWR